MSKSNGACIFTIWFFVLNVTVFVTGCPPNTATQANHPIESIEGAVSPALQTEAPKVPSIDAAIPGDFETASFGLG